MLTEAPSRRLRRTQSADLLALALLLLVCLAFYLPRLQGPISVQDEGILLAYPDLILKGALPYRDFAALYTPGSLYLVSLAFALFGESIVVERAVGLLYWYAMAAVLYFIGRPVSRLTGWLSACAVVIGLVFFPPGAYAMIGALALALAALLAAARSYSAQDHAVRRGLALLAGALASVVTWFRHDVGLLVTIALFCMFLTGPGFRLRHFIAGACLFAVPLLAYLSAAGFASSFESLVLDVLRNGPGRRLPVEVSVSLLALFALVALALANAVVAWFRNFADDEKVLLRGTVVLALGLMPSVLQRADGWHIIYVACPVLGLTVAGSAMVLRNINPRVGSLRLSLTGGLCMALGLAALAVYSVLRVKDTVPVVSGERFIYLARHAGVGELQAMVDEVNRIARPGQRLFVGPNDLRYTNYNDSYLYFLLPRLAPATRYLEMNPGVANREGSGLAGQLASADLVILNRSYDNWREQNASSIAGSNAASRMMESRFCEHRSFGQWRILLRCAPRAG
ncbi:MAG TPA: hypothetical protein VGE60_04125 [Telluria sp.]